MSVLCVSVTELRKRKAQANKEWIEKLPTMAKRLEEALYRQAPSKEEYQDLSTLKVRLQQVAMSMGKKEVGVTSQRGETRGSHLIDCLAHAQRFSFALVWLQVPSHKVERVLV